MYVCIYHTTWGYVLGVAIECPTRAESCSSPADQSFKYGPGAGGPFWAKVIFLGPPVVPFYQPFFWEGSPTKRDYRTKGTLLLTSLLEGFPGLEGNTAWDAAFTFNTFVPSRTCL